MASAIALVREPGIIKNHANAGEETTKLDTTMNTQPKNSLLIFVLNMTNSPKKGHHSDDPFTIMKEDQNLI